MTTETAWPDKREFSNRFGAGIADARIKNIREFDTSMPGIVARIYEFHHNFQTLPYVESRVDKTAARRPTEPALNPTDIVNLIARR
ncbi:MAG: hypothetical protein V4634_20425 [Pseudomonadota bacterium]